VRSSSPSGAVPAAVEWSAGKAANRAQDPETVIAGKEGYDA
jgi:hypothetical protein